MIDEHSTVPTARIADMSANHCKEVADHEWQHAIALLSSSLFLLATSGGTTRSFGNLAHATDLRSYRLNVLGRWFITSVTNQTFAPGQLASLQKHGALQIARYIIPQTRMITSPRLA